MERFTDGQVSFPMYLALDFSGMTIQTANGGSDFFR